MNIEVRGVPVSTWLDELFLDARYGFRLLRRRPAGYAVAILTMALGVGATTTLFTVTDGVLLRPCVQRSVLATAAFSGSYWWRTASSG
jgi:hypothetical protein